MRHFLDLRGDEADFAGGQLFKLLDLGAHAADAVHQMLGAGGHELDQLPLFQHALDDTDQDDDAEIGIVPAVDQHRLQRRLAVALGRGDAGDDRLEHLVDADARFGAGQDGVRRVEADDLLNLVADLVGLGGGQVDLVDDGDNLVIMLDRLIDIGERLRLDALRCIDHEQRTFACGEAAADFIGEIDMTRRVHQVELVFEPVLRGVIEAHGLRLDRDPAFLLDVHIVEHLCGHLAVGQPAGALDQPVRQRGLAMIDMRDDREIADAFEWCGHDAAPLAAARPKGKGRRAPVDFVQYQSRSERYDVPAF